MQLSVTNDEAGLFRAMAAVEHAVQSGQFDAETEYAIVVALEEVLTNVIKYSGLPAGSSLIEVTLASDETQTILEIADEGKAYDPLLAPEPDLDCTLEERSIGGLGVHMLRCLTKAITYERRQGKNVLRLVFPGADRQGEV